MTLPYAAKDLLPQQAPFQMIDTLLKSSESFFKSRFEILSENVLVHEGVLSEGAMIENMAQTAAAGTGYYAKLNNENVPKGYIGAIKHVEINTCPKVGDSIETSIELVNHIGNATIASGKIFLNNEIIASCELTIFVDKP